MRLPARLAAIGVTTLALTIAVVGIITYQLVRVSGRQDVDAALRQEQQDVANGLPALLADDDVTTERMQAAAQQYLAVHPGGPRHLTVIRIGNDTFRTREGPAALLELLEDGQLPLGTPGSIRTVETEEGAVRVLSAPVRAGDSVIGQVSVLAPFDDVAEDARSSLLRVIAAGAVGLVLGGVALVVATRRAVAPVGELARTARTTGTSDLSARVPEPARDDEVGQLAREFNRMLDRLETDAQQRRRLLAAVSHELRTPLAVASGHLDLFEDLDQADPAAGRELAVVVRGELERLTRVVDDLSAVTEGASDAIVVLGPVFVPDVLADLRARVTGLGLASRVRVADGPAVVVEVDAARLGQSLLNLVINATTHTSPGTTVDVRTRVDDGQLVVEVADDGAGIDPEVRDRIFEPFVTTRADGSGPGRGLGLAVVRSLTEAQGGETDLDSGPTGTTVSLRFPLPEAD